MARDERSALAGQADSAQAGWRDVVGDRARLAALGRLAASCGLSAEGLLVPADTPTTGADAPVVSVDPAVPVRETRHAWCQMCGPAKTACSTLCTLENGRWTHVEGNPNALNNGRRGGRTLCAKGNAAPQILYDPYRILYPMRRVGAKGEGRFVRCTWDEALSAIAAQLTALSDAYGPACYGVLSPQAYPVLRTVGRRFLNVFGSPNYLHSGICALQRRASKTVTIGAAVCPPAQLDKTRLLVVWGANPENSAVNQGAVTARLDALAAGATVVDIRPLLDPLASKADVWLPVRPGSDGALALAFLHVIIGEELYDRAFVDEWCHGFDELAAHVRAFPPEWAAPLTGIAAVDIRRVARMMGTTRPMGILYGNGIGDQQVDGHWTCAAICLIEAITGNLDVPGGGGAPLPPGKPLVKVAPIDVLTERLPFSEEDRANGWCAGASKLVAPETPRWYQTPATWESGPNSAYFRALMGVARDEPGHLRAVLGQASNPFGATRQPARVAEALRKLDLYVVHDTRWHPACDFADFVLPACTHYECSQQVGVKNGREGTFVAVTQPLARPMGESRSDWDLYLGLAGALGLGADFWDGDMDACLREQLADSGLTLEELRAAPAGVFVGRSADARPPEPPRRDYARLFAQLPHGKVQCANDWLGGRPDNRDEGTLGWLPEFTGPPEGPAETPELAREYPLVLSDVHAYRLCVHSYYTDTPWLHELQPTPWVKINPATAARYGIADGSWVRVESPHGRVRLVAEYFEGVAPGVLMTRRGWWRATTPDAPAERVRFAWQSDSSVLYDTDEVRFDPFHSAMAKQTLVRIAPWEEGSGDE